MTNTPEAQPDDVKNHELAEGTQDELEQVADSSSEVASAAAQVDEVEVAPTLEAAAAPTEDAAADEPEAADGSFEAMVDQTYKEEHSQDAKIGDKISGVVVKIGPEHSFVDFGSRSEATIKSSELFDEKGESAFAIGDPVEAFVVSADDEIVVSRFLQKQDRETNLLYQAFKSGMPVEGRVTAVNKWGLGVEIQGVRAFCPVSQIDTRYVEKTEDYRDQTFQFKIIRFRDQGRNIVVSRRALLESIQKEASDAVRDTLNKGAKLKGTVTRMEPFGAFVDLGGGVEGMVHVSELKHERVEHPNQVLQEGQEIEVVVLRLKDLGDKRKERISLSIKALEVDPWAASVAGFQVGTVVQGKVGALEEYGAFVDLSDSLRGLVHVSELADRRVAHPRDVLSVGDEVKVVVLEVDSRRKRLRLSVKQAETAEATSNLEEFQKRQEKEKEETSSGNALVEALKRAQLVD